MVKPGLPQLSVISFCWWRWQEAVGIHVKELVDIQLAILDLYSPQPIDSKKIAGHRRRLSTGKDSRICITPLRLTKAQLKWRKMRLEAGLSEMSLQPGPLSAGAYSCPNPKFRLASP